MATDHTTGFRPWFAASPRQIGRDEAFREAYEAAAFRRHMSGPGRVAAVAALRRGAALARELRTRDYALVQRAAPENSNGQ